MDETLSGLLPKVLKVSHVNACEGSLRETSMTRSPAAEL